LRPVRAADFQPGTCVDYLAAKGPVAGLAGYVVDGPLTDREIVDRLVQSAVSPGVAERGYIARALARAAPKLLADRRVQAAVGLLRLDPSEEVRAAASAIHLPQQPKGWFAALHRGIEAIRGPFAARAAARASSHAKSGRG